MPDLTDQERLPDEFYRGLNFLGRPSTVTLPGQEPGPPGEALAAGGAPVGPAPSGMPGAGPNPVGLPSSGLGQGLRALLTGASFGGRVLSDALSPTLAGAIETPSGQLTNTAPEVLRELQFQSPQAPLIPAEADLAEIAQNPALLGGNLNLGQYVGPGLSGLGDIYSIIQALRAGNPSGVVGPVSNLGILAATESGLIPTASSVAASGLTGLAGGLATAGAGATVSGMADILALAIQDMITDPHGRRSAAEDVNYLESQQVPSDVGALQAGAGILPFVSNPQNLAGLSNEQLMQLYATAAGGIRSSDYLADPLAQSGRTEAGITHPTLPGVAEQIGSLRPESIMATLRLDQELARRGIDPSAVTVGASGDPTGAFRLQPQILETTMFGQAPGQQGEFSDVGASAARAADVNQALQNLLSQSIWMDPATLTGMLPPGYAAPSAPSMAAASPMNLPAPPAVGTVFPFETA